MKTKVKPEIFALIVLLMILPILGACDDDGDDEGDKTVTPTSEPTPTSTQQPIEEVTFTIGLPTDKTGPAANALSITDIATEDLVDYYNEQDLIPDVKLEVISYDTIVNPAKFIPAYEWLKEKGADLIYTQVSSVVDVLKTEVNNDGMMLLTGSAASETLVDPGWVFSVSHDSVHDVWAMMKWVAENDWDFAANGPAKIGMAAWQDAEMVEYGESLEQYADAHPEQFEFVGTYLTTVGNFQWSTEVEALKDCDYVVPPRVGGATVQFVKEYRNAEYKAKFLGSNSHAAWLRVYSDADILDDLDGMIITMPTPYWDQEVHTVELARNLILKRSGPDELDDMIGEGLTYVSQIHSTYGLLQLIAETVERVGAQNLDSQALYDTAIQMSFNLAGNDWTWSETDRTSWDYVMMYKFDAVEGNFVTADTEWYLLPTAP